MAIETFEQLAIVANQIAEERGEWAGIPIPLDDLDLIVEKKFPYDMSRVCKAKDTDPDDPNNYPELVVVNSWWSFRLSREVIVMRNRKGRAVVGYQPAHKAAIILRTLGASRVWPMEAECKAMEKLHAMIGDHRFIQYLQTGTFLETSKRSDVKYLFRRLRPTLALRPTPDGKDTRVLCALCAHSVGYYQDTWAGVLPPTDEVISALCWMRGDEAKWWAQCNQHNPNCPQAGL
jgi:hypothetical protein